MGRAKEGVWLNLVVSILIHYRKETRTYASLWRQVWGKLGVLSHKALHVAVGLVDFGLVLGVLGSALVFLHKMVPRFSVGANPSSISSRRGGWRTATMVRRTRRFLARRVNSGVKHRPDF